ncbi:MAG: endonuclease/exonuclease/phosphatase family protein [Clostridia bacterium]|nr:endonuclease/exonuclease/phosphatase family protein [Clostridia bacterium]
MSKEKKPFKIRKVFLGLLLAVIVLAVGAFLVLALTEYNPKDVETIAPPSGSVPVQLDTQYTVISYNTGYAALGEDADFFMDGGKTTRPDSKAVIETYMDGIAKELSALHADFYMLQEVDLNAKRSYGTDEVKYYSEHLGLPYDFALNFKSTYTPYPIPDMIGHVESGLAFYTDRAVSSASRIQLPIPFSWPVRCFNLKRCLLVNRLPIEGSDKELVMIDLHIEAYDDGQGKIAQTKQLYDLLAEEYSKGNYVIAGGDFNQTFPGAKEYPAINEGCWMPGTLENTLPQGYEFAFDADSPSCRLLDVPYKGNENPQYYIIDGFIVSSNVSVDEVGIVETNFVNSDHQPVKLMITLKP